MRNFKMVRCTTATKAAKAVERIRTQFHFILIMSASESRFQISHATQTVHEYGKPEATKLWTDCGVESLLTQCCQ